MIKLKDLINEGKWKYTGWYDGDTGSERFWEYNRSFFDMISNFLKRRSGKLPKIKSIKATLDSGFSSTVDSVVIKIVLGNPITIEKERDGASDFYDVFDNIVVISEKPFTKFEVESFIQNKKNSESIDDVEFNKLIQKMLDELKPELQKYTK